MVLRRLRAFINPLTRLRRARALRGIRSAEQFLAMLERERRKTDRNQHVFSLVLFDVGSTDANHDELQRLAEELGNRIRSTDDTGWFDSQRIGVLLPYTPPVGARKVAGDVCRAFAEGAYSPEFTVYTYPTDWLGSDNGDGDSQEQDATNISPAVRDRSSSEGLVLSTKRELTASTAEPAIHGLPLTERQVERRD